MQTFFNPKTPFFDAEGKPMANARVTFLSVDTSGAPLVVRDFYGNILDNPMTTQSDGTLKDVPYFDDGVSYKVVVEKPTGVPAVYVLDRIVNESEMFKPAYEFIVSSMGAGESGLINATFVDGIVGVRNADKNLGSVVCNGYTTKNDGCPSRVFKWIESAYPMPDNGVNSLRNVNDNTGYWKMEEPQGVFDVRFGGLFPTNGDVDSSIKLSNILSAINQSNVDTIYFPQGEYYFSGNHFVKSIVLERGCNFRPFRGNDAVFNIGKIENRGGKFEADEDGGIVFPKLGSGVFHTEWLSGMTLAAFMYDGSRYNEIFKDVDVIVLDGDIEYSSLPVTIDLGSKAVVNAAEDDIPPYIKANVIIDLKNGAVQGLELSNGKLSIKGTAISYDGAVVVIVNETTKDVNFPKGLIAQGVRTTEISADAAFLKAANIPDGNDIIKYFDDDDELLQGQKGDVIIAVNSAEKQIFLTIDKFEGQYPSYTKMPVNAGTCCQLLCIRSYQEPSAQNSGMATYAKWIPMSPTTTTRKVNEFV